MSPWYTLIVQQSFETESFIPRGNFLRRTIFARPLLPKVNNKARLLRRLSDKTSYLEETETSPTSWKRFRPTESLGKNTPQPVKLPAGLYFGPTFFAMKPIQLQYERINTNLNSVYTYFVKNFCIYVHQQQFETPLLALFSVVWQIQQWIYWEVKFWLLRDCCCFILRPSVFVPVLFNFGRSDLCQDLPTFFRSSIVVK